MKYRVNLKGRIYEVEVEKGEAMLVDEYEAAAPAVPAPTVSAVTLAAGAAPGAVPAPQAAPADAAGTAAFSVSGMPVTAPLPGNILAINVQKGDKVKAGDVLVIIEAMKMENEVLAPCDGLVKEILTSKGAVVATGNILLVI